MKKIAVIVAILAVSATAVAVTSVFNTTEVLVSNTAPTLMPRHQYRTGWEIDNNGPNAEDCAIGQNAGDGGSPVYDDGGLVLGSAAVVGTGHAKKIVAGGAWSGVTPVGVQIWCLAYTAAQVAGAATVITESP